MTKTRTWNNHNVGLLHKDVIIFYEIFDVVLDDPEDVPTF